VNTKTNVLVIVSDTFRRDHLGAYGNSGIHTPYLDAFAEECIVFDQHVVSSFPTIPARADILTGRHSFLDTGWEPLPPDIPTLPGLLSEAGVLTMGIVDTPFFLRNEFNYDRGFTDFIAIRGQGDDLRPEERRDSRATWRSESDRFVAQTMSTAENWLERHYKEPFFLYVDTWDPHEPWDPPEYYTALYRPAYDGEEVYPCYGFWETSGLTSNDVAIGHATYCGEVTMVDRWIGGLLNKLDVLGIRDRTTVIFLSDHGFYFGEHGYFGKADWRHTADSDVKEDEWLAEVHWSPLYQEVTRIPLMIRTPKRQPRRSQALTAAPDIAPTILELFGLPVSETMQGEGLGKVLADGSDDHRPFVMSSWPLDLSEGSVTTAVDSRRRRVGKQLPLTITTLDRSLIVGGPEDEPEFYDLSSDAREAHNIYKEREREAAELCRIAIEWLNSHGTMDRLMSERRMALEALAKRA
jgi:arylsulfatase A-like enzyme